MEWNTGAHDLHIVLVVLRASLTWTERASMRFFETRLLFQKEVRELFIRRELVSERLDNLRKEIFQGSLSRLDTRNSPDVMSNFHS